MSTNVEIEAKILVTAPEFRRLFTFLGVNPKDAIRQINYYIDTPDSQLRSFGFGLRIRERLGEYTLTLKSPLAEGTLEKNQTLTSESYDKLAESGLFPAGPVHDFLALLGFPIKELRIITSLTTHRLETTYQGRHLALDRNEFSRQEDFEIESEQSAVSLAAETLKNLCREAKIEYRPNQISKHARALKALAN
jgi:uncharacterized protein YjbK